MEKMLRQCLSPEMFYTELMVRVVAFVNDNATMSSILYFENHVSILCKTEDPIKLISLRQVSVSIALKYIINNNILK